MKLIYSIAAFLLLVLVFVFAISSKSQASKLVRSAADSPGTNRPVVVELFTSEGCSSCPPADQLLKKLSEEPKVHGAEIIALEEHVDYWDHLGWKDPYSSADFTERQEEYSHILENGSVYTPQMVIDGQNEVIGSRTSEALAVIQKAASQPKLEIQISAGASSENNKAAFDIKITKIAALPDTKDIDLWVAITEKDLSSDVKAGENSGEHLQHGPVVRRIQKLESFRGPSDHQAHAAVKLDTSWRRENLNFVVFTTDKHSHKITGAAASKIL
jgi:hypothetical protein